MRDAYDFSEAVKNPYASKQEEAETPSDDPFYSPANLRHLEAIIATINVGTAHLVEHELIDPED